MSSQVSAEQHPDYPFQLYSAQIATPKQNKVTIVMKMMWNALSDMIV